MFVFFFVVSVTFVIVNMFVSILNETFGAVRADINKQSNDYEIIDFMISRFRRFTGFGAQQHTTLTPEELRNQEQERRSVSLFVWGFGLVGGWGGLFVGRVGGGDIAD